MMAFNNTIHEMEFDSSRYQYLIGKSKDQLINIHGMGVNYYYFNTWTYYLKTNWYGQKIYLFIYFEDNVVVRVNLKSLRDDFQKDW